jgi:hypothetical protein
VEKAKRFWIRYLIVLVFGLCAFDFGLLIADWLSSETGPGLTELLAVAFATFVFGLMALLQVGKAEVR